MYVNGSSSTNRLSQFTTDSPSKANLHIAKPGLAGSAPCLNIADSTTISNCDTLHEKDLNKKGSS